MEFVRFSFKYFAFIAVGVNAFNFLIARKKFAKPEMLIFFIAFNSVFLMMGILQLLGGYETFFYIFLPPSSDILILLYWIYHLGFLGLSTLWVLYGNGSEILAESGFMRGVNTPNMVKIFFPLAIFITIAVLFIGHQFGWLEESVRNTEAILH